MSEFLIKYLKIRSGFFKRMRFIFILDMISIFSILYAIFIILNAGFFLEKYSSDLPVQVKFIPPFLAFIIGLIGAFLLHRKDKRINVTYLIEGKNPELREKLRTAYDNRKEDNIVVESLKSNVSSLLTNVSSSRLLSGGRIFFKVLITIIFISGAVYIHLNPDEYSIPPDTLTDIARNLTGDDQSGSVGPIVPIGLSEEADQSGKGASGEIFGKPKIASIEGKNIDLTLYSGMETGFDVRDSSETRNEFIQSAEFPVDVLGSNVSDGGYSILMKKTEIEKELINKYAVERSKI